MNTTIDEKELRKAWLKRKFSSFEYHEEMLRLHQQFVKVIARALDGALKDDSPNKDYGTRSAFAKNFAQTDWPLIQGNDDAGKYKKDEWAKFSATATFRSVPDYNRYLRDGDRLGWMTDDEQTELSKFWGPMARMAENIRYTVDGNWDAHPDEPYWILDEEYTGPITWPANWRDEVADLATGTPLTALRCEANQPCPRTGFWLTPANINSRRRFQQGQVMPELNSDYGKTIWQWDERQSN